ncbi:hypothetical protein [Flavobacterium sp.]|uniref:hypothetical protein n=1 Tax=Flavobacterium sp. TaxID=239 RepID=UPI0035AE9A69
MPTKFKELQNDTTNFIPYSSLIGAYYARKYGNKAKRDIEKYNQNKEQEKIKNKLD